MLTDFASALFFAPDIPNPTIIVRTATYASFRKPCKRRWSYARCYSAGEPSDRHINEKTAQVDVNPNSIFSSHGDSAWDRVFENLDDYKAQTSPSRRETTARPGKSFQRQEGRRQAMTAREMSAFDEIFSMIFDVADKHDGGSSPAQQESSKVNAVGSMVTSLRLRSRVPRWATEQDELLDRKKEQIDLCATDVELLHWAQREVLDAFDSGPEGQTASINFTETAEESAAQSRDERPPSTSSGALHPRTYSHLVAYLMRTFRDKYTDPYLALALFDKVRHRSLASYVFGCSTQVYNELIETMWLCFRDLRSVHNALEEMVVNGVVVDVRTAKLVGMVRRQVGERNVWAENLDHRNGEIWHLLLRLDHFIAKSRSSKKKKAPQWGQWKERPRDMDEDSWEFDQWSRTAQG